MLKRKKNAANKAAELIKQGLSVGDACKKVGITISTYYYYKSAAIAAANVAKRATVVRKLRVVSLPDVPPVQSRGAFLVIGSPVELAAFARAYQ